MKVSDLFEAQPEFISTMLGRATQLAAPKKAGQPFEVKAKNAYSRGFRSAFGGPGGDNGIGNDVAKFYEQGEKDGKVAAKAYKKEHNEQPPVSHTSNRYGEKKVNQAFERIIKAAIAPYLEKLTFE